VALQQRIEPNEARIAFGLQHVRPRADAVLVTHAHFDHLLDVPEIMRRTNARLVAGVTAANLTMSCGVDRTRCLIVNPDRRALIGPWRIRVLPAAHDRILGWLPFRRTRSQPGICPAKASDWRLGEPMAFLIEANGKRIYVDSGGNLKFCRRLKSRFWHLPISFLVSAFIAVTQTFFLVELASQWAAFSRFLSQHPARPAERNPSAFIANPRTDLGHLDRALPD
jgi:hypothetical protein